MVFSLQLPMVGALEQGKSKSKVNKKNINLEMGAVAEIA